MSRRDKRSQSQRPPEVKEKKRPVVEIKPLNEKQGDCLASLYSMPCVINTGAAGTGKTYLAASVAAQDLASRRISSIVLSRANVATGKSLGAFPGTVEEKLSPWLLPITDVLRLHLGNGFFDHALKTGAIQYQPIETIRGRSFQNAIVLIDEAQQLTPEELKAITTRTGKGSRLFLMGDRNQRDVHTDGLAWLQNIVEKYNLPVDFYEFTSDDCVRSDLCTAFVKAFEQEGV